jgi:hypothetical protein
MVGAQSTIAARGHVQGGNVSVPALDAIDRRIGDLDAAVEHMGNNLIALDDDVTRQMLGASTTLEGRTAQAWELGERQIAEVWRGHVALRDHLATITDIRGTKANISRSAVGRLTELLDGPTVSVADPDNARGHHGLTSGADPAFVCTIAQLIAQMSAGYDSVLALVGAVGTAWTDTLPRLAEVESQIDRLEAAVSDTGARRPNELVQARRALGEGQATALGDPLSLAADTLASITAMVDRATASVRGEVATRQEAVDQAVALEGSLASCGRVLARARAEGDRVAERVILPTTFWAAVEQAEADLTDCRLQFEVLTGPGAEPMAERSLIAETTRRMRGIEERATGLATQAALALEAREELRGRLDVYRAKSQAIGLGEDAGLEALYGTATGLLFVAPCDLDLAEVAVQSFQAAIRQGNVGSA